MKPVPVATAARLDVLGLALSGAGIGWTYLSGTTSGGSVVPFAGLFLSTIAVLLVGRVLASIHRMLIPGIVIGVAAALAFTTPDLLSSAPLSGPFGYANAKGAFFFQAAVAALMLVAGFRTTHAKLFGLVLAAGFAIVPFAVESVTPAALILLLPAGAFGIYSWAGARTAVTACAALFIVALAGTIALGLTYAPGSRSGRLDRVVDSTLTERRPALWHEALVVMSEHPVTGVGVGGFQVFSPTARSDPDARWAHNQFLQQGAETGLIGLILLLLLFVWGFAMLAIASKADTVSVLGAVALAGLGIHSSIDYILHFPAVPLTAAALVGSAGVGPRSKGELP